tara:strand:- start:6838 stop:7056 length:219 start_codon:yes stop_codon:yes gene_type:complete
MAYRKNKNWSSHSGSFRNGNNKSIKKPRSYFNAVATNRYGYNDGYQNGNGRKIHKPVKYFQAVSEDRYGYNK